ncbi:MAG: hypothetical protein ACYCYO_21590 [Bacilli bacterium]
MAFYGSDSNTITTCTGGSPQFYLGQMGSGTTPNQAACGGGSPFQSTAATDAGKSNTFGYWWLMGPTEDPNYNVTTSEAYAWGENQAVAAVNARNSSTYSTVVGRITIFADIETFVPSSCVGKVSEYMGWLQGQTTQDYDLNQAVWNGFKAKVWSYSNNAYPAGVYCSPSNWATLMNGLSLSGVDIWTSENCCYSSCQSMSGASGFGGGTLSIYQFDENPDYDVADSLPA